MQASSYIKVQMILLLDFEIDKKKKSALHTWVHFIINLICYKNVWVFLDFCYRVVEMLSNVVH